MSAHEWLPGVLAEIADAAGIEAALAVARDVGGTRVSILPNPPDDNWLVKAVGRERADQIAAAVATTRLARLVVPRGARAFARRYFHDLRQAGEPVVRAAQRAGVDERTGFNWERERKRGAWRFDARPAPATRQISLLDLLDETAPLDSKALVRQAAPRRLPPVA